MLHASTKAFLIFSWSENRSLSYSVLSLTPAVLLQTRRIIPFWCTTLSQCWRALRWPWPVRSASRDTLRPNRSWITRCDGLLTDASYSDSTLCLLTNQSGFIDAMSIWLLWSKKLGRFVTCPNETSWTVTTCFKKIRKSLTPRWTISSLFNRFLMMSMSMSHY